MRSYSVPATSNTSSLILPRKVMLMRKRRLRKFKVLAHSWTINIRHVKGLKPGLFIAKAHAFSIKIGHSLRIQFILFPVIAIFLPMSLNLEFYIRIKSHLVVII